MNNVVTTLAPSILIGSSSFLQATSKPIISWMGSKFSRIQPGTFELLALERLEIRSLELAPIACLGMSLQHKVVLDDNPLLAHDDCVLVLDDK